MSIKYFIPSRCKRISLLAGQLSATSRSLIGIRSLDGAKIANDVGLDAWNVGLDKENDISRAVCTHRWRGYSSIVQKTAGEELEGNREDG